MESQRSTRTYDLFKLIVALFLLALLIILLLTLRAAGPVSRQNPAVAVPPATAAAVLEEATASPTSPPAATATLLAPSPTPTAPPPTPTSAPASAADTATPAPTTAEGTPTLTADQAAAISDCKAAIPSRLAVGTKARVINNLNFRSSAGLENNNLIRVNPVGTQLEVTGGPTCVKYGSGAYLWWEVRSADGQTGWSAEGSLEGTFYFLEPVK